MTQIQAGDTAFILIAAALVLLMTPGLALFYGGMVRSKNVLGTIMQSFVMISVISLEWVYLGYSMSFGPDVGGFVGPNAAVIIGLLAGVCCYFAVVAKSKIGYDDSLDVVGIHGLGGIIGTLCLGIFASKIVNPGGSDGLLAGNPGFLGIQAFGVVVVGVYAFSASWILLKVLNATMGMRVSEEAEVGGLDLNQHSETAYNT